MTVTRTLLEPAAHYRSPIVGAFVAGLDDQSRRLEQATRDLSVEELGWQQAPGTNTIGMLLAHLAVAEAHIVDVALAGLETSRIRELLGIAMEDDGMPLPEQGRPPEALAGRDIAFFDDLLRRARAHTHAVAAPLRDEDLPHQIVRTRPDGSTRIFDVRWMLYHLLEHFAGHHAQVLQLRHFYRATRLRV